MAEYLRCPATKRSRADAEILGVYVGGRVRFVEQLAPLTPQIEQIAASQNLHINRVMRLTGACYHYKTYWRGERCALVERVLAKIAPAEEPELPACPIRFDGPGGCRWYAQAGTEICRRCVTFPTQQPIEVFDGDGIATIPHDPSPVHEARRRPIRHWVNLLFRTKTAA
jgi:hypothetical protein